jgi:hypothetical protein
MFKKTAIAFSLTFATLASANTFAADESTIINISADIPTKQFHARPRDPNFGRAEVMNYNTVTGQLSSLRAIYDVKNTDGHVEAYIEGGPAVLSNGTTSIALTTTFNGVELTGSPKEVVDDASSTPGTQADMLIVAAKPADADTGLFNADFVVVFDSVPRTPTL